MALNFYTPGTTRYGSVLGSALGNLGRVLEPLDYPRQALWNLPGKLMEGDYAAAVPGIAGLGAGALVALMTGGLAPALLAGSLAGGSAQGVGKSVDPDRFEAPTPEQVTGSDSALLNFLTAMAGDPMTYAGMSGGARAGKMVGQGLDNAAMRLGPMYKGGESNLIDALANSMNSGGDVAAVKRAEAMMSAIVDSPEGARVMAEVAPGGRLIGAGSEAMAITNPETNTVTRIAGGPGTLDVRETYARNRGTVPLQNSANTLPPAPRVDDPAVLQPIRQVTAGPYRVEHLPRMDVLEGNLSPATMTPQALEARHGMFADAADQLYQSVESRGMWPVDVRDYNVGRVPYEDRWLITDGGAVLPRAGTPAAADPAYTSQPNALLSALLELTGGPRAVRKYLARNAYVPPGVGLTLPEAAGVGARSIPTPSADLLAATKLGG